MKENYLISNIHLVEFINATNAIVSKHQCTSLREKKSDTKSEK
jgi:hypothetical protein